MPLTKDRSINGNNKTQSEKFVALIPMRPMLCYSNQPKSIAINTVASLFVGLQLFQVQPRQLHRRASAFGVFWVDSCLVWKHVSYRRER